jgi:hypothetical protein
MHFLPKSSNDFGPFFSLFLKKIIFEFLKIFYLLKPFQIFSKKNQKKIFIFLKKNEGFFQNFCKNAFSSQIQQPVCIIIKLCAPSLKKLKT